MGIGFPELIVILMITFLIFGGRKLPELGAGLGKAIRSFNKGLRSDDQPDDTDAEKDPKKIVQSDDKKS